MKMEENTEYRLDREQSAKKQRPLRTPGPVLYWETDAGKAVIFSCPCGEREVYVCSPPHEIAFDEAGRLTIKASCGYRERPNLGRPANWCHFQMTAGKVEMYDDSRCPGAART